MTLTKMPKIMKHDSLNGIGYYKDKLGTERWPQM